MASARDLLKNLYPSIGNPLEWSASSKASLLLALTFLYHLQYTLWGHYLLYLPERDHLVHEPFLRTQLPIFHLLAGLSFLLFVLIMANRRRIGNRSWCEHLAAQYYALTLCYFSYTVGTLTLPTGAVITGAPVVGLILFNRAVVFWAFANGLGIQVLLSYGAALGYLDYAPVIKSLFDDQGRLSLPWLNFMYIFTAPHLFMLVLLAYYVLRRWRQREEEVRYLSMTDPLTGVSNRRSILSLLGSEMERSRRQGLPLSVMMVDLDHFKRINDTYGHATGDAVLVAATQALRQSVRQNDQIGRLGGEEFLVVLPGTDSQGALVLAERCRSQLAELQLETGTGQMLRVSASIGVCCTEINQIIRPETLLHQADLALYQAKAAGRNRIALAGNANALPLSAASHPATGQGA